MAECCVCNKKIGFLDGFILQTKFNKYMVCNVCSDMIWNGLKKNDINAYIALRKFYPTMNADVKEYIDDKWASARRSTENIEAEIAAHEKAEREERENATRLSEIKSSMLLTTGYNFECYNISEYVGVISGIGSRYWVSFRIKCFKLRFFWGPIALFLQKAKTGKRYCD